MTDLLSLREIGDPMAVAASNSLVTLRKDRGLPMSAYAAGLFIGPDGTRAEADASSLQQLVAPHSVKCQDNVGIACLDLL